MVDLPPRGIKRLKNSRKMQMVFFVFYGRVMVKVGDTNFSIGKGGMWQVPRGEYFSYILLCGLAHLFPIVNRCDREAVRHVMFSLCLVDIVGSGLSSENAYCH